MVRRNLPPSVHIYGHARGAGWILTALGDHWDAPEHATNPHRWEFVMYYTADKYVETKEVGSPGRFIDQWLDLGVQLGSYPGASPEANVEYSEQSRAVRMQRHAPDIYAALGNAKGMSETVAVRAAETFGSKWTEKDDREEWQTLKQVGEGTANSIVLYGDTHGIWK